VCKDDVIISVL